MSKRYNFARKVMAVLLSAACFAMLLPAPMAHAATAGGSSIQTKLSEFFNLFGGRTAPTVSDDAIPVSTTAAEETLSAAENTARIGVVYHANGGSGASPYQYNTGVTLDASALDVPIFGASDPVNFSHSGAVLKCWNTAPDGSGTTYTPGAVIPALGSSLTLYAIWETNQAAETDTGAPVVIPAAPKHETKDSDTTAIDLADGDTSLQGSEAAALTAYYEYDAATHTLTIKQNPPAGDDSYTIWQSGSHTVQSIAIASGVTADIIVSGITVASPISACTPLILAAGAQPTLVLAGANTFSANDAGGTGVYIPAGAELTLNGSGSVNITATGGIATTNSGTLTITGGTVTATAAGTYAAISGATLNVSGGALNAAGGSGIQCDIVNISGNAEVNATGKNDSGIESLSLAITGSADVTAKGIGSGIGSSLFTIDDGATVYAYSDYDNNEPAIDIDSKIGTGWYVNAFFNSAPASSYDPYTLSVYDDADNAVTALEGYRAFAFHLPGMTAAEDYTIFLENASLTEEVLRLNDDDPAIYSINAPTGYSAHMGTDGALPVKLGGSVYSIKEIYIDRDGNEIAAQTTTKVAQGGTYSNAMPFITDYAAMGWIWADDYALLTPPVAKTDCTEGDPANLAVTGSRTIYFVYAELDFVPTGMSFSGGWGMLLLAAMAMLMLAASFVWQVQKRRRMN